MKVFIDFSKLHWQSDWNGDEVGYENVNVIGLYSWKNEFNEDVANFYIDMETMEALEFWVEKGELDETNVI